MQNELQHISTQLSNSQERFVDAWMPYGAAPADTAGSLPVRPALLHVKQQPHALQHGVQGDTHGGCIAALESEESLNALHMRCVHVLHMRCTAGHLPPSVFSMHAGTPANVWRGAATQHTDAAGLPAACHMRL